MSDTLEQVSKDLDALHTRLIQLAIRHGGALGDDIRDKADIMQDMVVALNFAIEKQERRDRADERMGEMSDERVPVHVRVAE